MTETIAVVFTDLVDSTKLLASLGDDAFDEVRREHFSVLRSVIDEHGGTEVKNLGDGLMVVFRSASDAITAAVAMQVESDRQGRRAGATSVGLKVGASIGDATPEDGDWFGTPVVEAARLCALATSGQLLITDVMRMMAGSRAGDRVESIGLVELKGLPDPLAVCDVRWDPATADDVVPLPAALAVSAEAAFAGRGAERAVLDDAWTAAQSGATRTVFVAGEPGIGKTRLVSEVARHAHASGAVVFFGRSEDEIDAPFRPFAEALDQLVQHAPDEVLAEHVAEMAGAAVGIAPALRKRTGVALEANHGAESARLISFNAVADLVRRQAELAPVVLVFDDLHWADESSLLLLRHLIQTVVDARLLILATYRDSDLDRHHPLANMLADFRRVGGVERVGLDGLSQAEVLEYLVLAGSEDLSSEGVELGRQLAELTSGNPFFMTETLRHLAESGVIAQRNGRWVQGDRTAEEVGVPEGVREVVGRRLSALDADTEVLLSVAAVAGAQFDSAVVGAVAGLAEDVVLDGLDLACTRSLVIEDVDRFGWYRFGHALVRQTLIEELSTTRRIRLHRALGEQLEKVAPDRVEEIAHHYLESAAAGSAAKAVEFAAMAARRAVERMAQEQAASWFQRALEAEETLAPDSARRCELLLELGHVRNLASDEQAAGPLHLEAAQLARTAGRTDLLARAAYQYLGPFGFWVSMDDEVRRPLLDEALAGLGTGEYPDLRMLLLIKLLAERSFDRDPTERFAFADEAIDIARTMSDPLVRFDGLVWTAFQLLSPDRIEICEELAAEAAALAEDLPPATQAQTVFLQVVTERIRGRFGAAQSSAERYLSVMEPLGAAHRSVRLGEPASRAIAQGRFAEGRRLLDLVREGGMHGDLLSAGATQSWVDLWVCDVDSRADPDAPYPEAAAQMLDLFPGRAITQLMKGDEVAARRALEAWKGVLPFVPSVLRPHVAAFASYPVWRLADVETAGALLDLLMPHRGLWLSVVPVECNGPVDLYLGMALLTLGRPAEAEEHLRALVALTEREGVRAWEAWSLQFMAQALLDQGREADAAVIGARCRALAEELGMVLILRDLDVALPERAPTSAGG